MTAFLNNQSWWKLALISGLFVGLSFPPLRLGFLAWFGLVPLLAALNNVSPKSGFKYSFLAGTIVILITIYWLSFNIGTYVWAAFLSMIGAILYLALFWGIIGFIFSLIHTRTGKGFLLLPFIWAAVEFLMSFGTLGFPWASLATTQVEYLPLIQMVDITGIYGLSFWVVTINVLIYRYLFSPSVAKRRIIIAGLILFIIPWMWGSLRLFAINTESQDSDEFRISLIQPNVGPKEKWDRSKKEWNFNHLDSLFVEAAKESPQLIVWPESAMQAYLRKNPRRLEQVRRRVIEYDIPLMTGTVDWEYSDEIRKIYNGALLIEPSGKLSIFHKINLVPFGEYIPLSEWFSVLDNLNLGQGNFDFGDTYTIFDVDSTQFAAVICFEDIFPQLVRKFSRLGAEFLIVVVNDGWYGNTSEPYQHALIARFRAIENRMPVVRCANTGISVIYDASGKVIDKLSVDSLGIITAGISPGHKLTFYTKYGDIFAKFCIFFTIIIGGWLWYRNR